MDFVMGLPLDGGYNAIYTVVEKLTKLVKLIPCFVGEGELSAPATAKLFFDNIVRSFGVPSTVIHDRDPRFTSSFWSALFELIGSRVVLSTAFHP